MFWSCVRPAASRAGSSDLNLQPCWQPDERAVVESATNTEFSVGPCEEKNLMSAQGSASYITLLIIYIKMNKVKFRFCFNVLLGLTWPLQPHRRDWSPRCVCTLRLPSFIADMFHLQPVQPCRHNPTESLKRQRWQAFLILISFWIALYSPKGFRTGGYWWVLPSPAVVMWGRNRRLNSLQISFREH